MKSKLLSKPWILINLLRCSKSEQGFTLIELLVVTILSGIVISALLWGVVELLRNDRRESALSKTQQEMQLALDYITQDLRQAVYIYDSSCNAQDADSCPSYIDYVPSVLDNADSIPVLAFWKTVPLDDEDFNLDGDSDNDPNPDSTDTTDRTSDGIIDYLDVCDRLFGSTASKESDCQTLYKQRNTYSLVVYSQFTDDTSTLPWSGRSYIRRYELQKYKTIGSSTANDRLTRTTGFVDPSEVSGIFSTWPYSGSTNCQLTSNPCRLVSLNGVTEGAMTSGNATSYATLVDFVDCPASSATGCSTYTFPAIPDADSTTTGTQPCPTGYTQTPSSVASDNNITSLLSRSFFACIRSGGTGTGENFQGESQDVIVYLRGNARSIGTAPETRLSSDEFTPLLKTQITMRGVIDFTP